MPRQLSALERTMEDYAYVLTTGSSNVKYIVRDRHAIPRIQETLENLDGSSWFSVLDRGKAYHQGFIEKGSRHLTAFITHWGLCHVVSSTCIA